MKDEEPQPSATAEAVETTPAYFSAFLRYFRDAFVTAVAALDEKAARTSLVPSGWTPIELLSHVLYMERRWFVWGFLGEDVDDPWGDSQGNPDSPWLVPDGVTVAELSEQLTQLGERTSEVLTSRVLSSRAALGGRFTEDPPDLGWICFHVLQEYARHTGHLDIVVELGSTRE